MKKSLIVYNPIAGKDDNRIWIDRLVERIKYNNDFSDVAVTEYAEHGRNIAFENAGKYDVIVSAGGDGTLNEIATGVLDSGADVSIGILPIGSGNDYYRNFGDPEDLDRAIATITDGKEKLVDIGKGSSGKYLLNIASIGLDCLTVKNAKKLKKIVGGPLGYFLSLVYSLIVFKKQKLSIYIDDKKIEADSVLYCFGKGRTYGGGICIMPWSDCSDGVFHMVNMVDINKLLLILLSPSIAVGKHTKFKKYVKVYKGRKIRVESEKKYDFNLDGEIFEGTETVEYECIPKALSIMVQ